MNNKIDTNKAAVLKVKFRPNNLDIDAYAVKVDNTCDHNNYDHRNKNVRKEAINYCFIGKVTIINNVHKVITTQDLSQNTYN